MFIIWIYFGDVTPTLIIQFNAQINGIYGMSI